MPRLDGTGPYGYGPRTGWGFGPCGGGIRRGRGSYCYGFKRYISPKNELSALEEDEKILTEELSVIHQEKEALKDRQK